MKEIMLNKAFAGDWGTTNEQHIPHEIINNFRSDNGKIYIYVPPYGGFDTKSHKEIDSILITGTWNNKETEVLYAITGLTRCHNGKKNSTKEEMGELRNFISKENIKYGGKLLYEIEMGEKKEDLFFYLTFEAKQIKRPKQPMYLSWSKEKEHNSNKNVFVLSNTTYKYQRLIGYISGKDYETMSDIISNVKYWEKVEVPKVPITDIEVNNTKMNFVKLIHKEYDETIFSNLFYEFFSRNQKLFNLFVNNVLDISGNDNYEIKKEVTTSDKKGRIDILAEGKKNIIVIENKINSGLNGIDKDNQLSQLTTYIIFAEKKYKSLNLERKYFLFHPEYNNIDISKFDKKRGSEFTKISYKKIYEFLNKNLEELRKTPEIGEYYAEDFVNALHHLSLTMHDIVEARFIKAIKNVNKDIFMN